ncbi:hypothetical protein HK097_000481, partial [Rhizophlyctis rosea]
HRVSIKLHLARDLLTFPASYSKLSYTLPHLSEARESLREPDLFVVAQGNENGRKPKPTRSRQRARPTRHPLLQLDGNIATLQEQRIRSRTSGAPRAGGLAAHAPFAGTGAQAGRGGGMGRGTAVASLIGGSGVGRGISSTAITAAAGAGGPANANPSVAIPAAQPVQQQQQPLPSQPNAQTQVPQQLITQTPSSNPNPTPPTPLVILSLPPPPPPPAPTVGAAPTAAPAPSHISTTTRYRPIIIFLLRATARCTFRPSLVSPDYQSHDAAQTADPSSLQAQATDDAQNQHESTVSESVDLRGIYVVALWYGGGERGKMKAVTRTVDQFVFFMKEVKRKAKGLVDIMVIGLESPQLQMFSVSANAVEPMNIGHIHFENMEMNGYDYIFWVEMGAKGVEMVDISFAKHISWERMGSAGEALKEVRLELDITPKQLTAFLGGISKSSTVNGLESFGYYGRACTPATFASLKKHNHLRECTLPHNVGVRVADYKLLLDSNPQLHIHIQESPPPPLNAVDKALTKEYPTRFSREPETTFRLMASARGLVL